MRKFVYFGTPRVASDTLSTLLGRNIVPALVVTAPDRPKGRGLELAPSPVKELALEHALPCITPEKLDAAALDAIRAAGADYAVVVAYGQLFPAELIEAFPRGALSVHYSLLPKYRGATPLEAALLSGDKETGVTVQQMALALDAGDILAQRTIPIAPDDTARELRPRLIALGAELLADTLPAFEKGELSPVKQGDSSTPYAKKLRKEDGLLDLNAPAEENWNKYRAFADSIGTYFFADRTRVKIVSASLIHGRFIPDRVIPEGKREMAYTDFARNR